LGNVSQIAETGIIETRAIRFTGSVGDEERDGLSARDKNRWREGYSRYIVVPR